MSRSIVRISARRCAIAFIFIVFGIGAYAPGATAQSIPSFLDTQVLYDSTVLPLPTSQHNHPPAIASDGAGTWITVWPSRDTLGGTLGTDLDLLYSLSADDGQTWSAAAAFNTDATVDGILDEGRVALATNGTGTWLAAYSKFINVTVIVSTDNGATWSAPIDTGAEGYAPAPATDGAGNWVLVFESDDTLGGTIGPDREMLSISSSDDGFTWTAPVVVDSLAVVDADTDVEARLATDGAGVWIATWRSGTMVSATSTDNGATWNGTTVISPDPFPFQSSTIDTDGAGKWIVAWAATELSAGTSNQDLDIVFASSFDDGATWSGANWIHFDGTRKSRVDEYPRMRHVGNGHWHIVWETLLNPDKLTKADADYNLLFSSSRDNGLSWRAPTAVDPGDGTDADYDRFPRMDFNPSTGTWIVVWQSIGYDTVGMTLTDDADILMSRSTAGCPSAPVGGCFNTVAVGRSRILLRDGKGGKDKLIFKWQDGDAVSATDIGTPDVADDYVLCLWEDVGGIPETLWEEDIPAGRTCGGVPCWTALVGGYEYRDRRSEQGSTNKMRILEGAAGASSLLLKGKGPRLDAPRTPIAVPPNLTFQMHNLGNGACWEAVFPVPTANDPLRFKARIP